MIMTPVRCCPLVHAVDAVDSVGYRGQSQGPSVLKDVQRPKQEDSIRSYILQSVGNPNIVICPKVSVILHVSRSKHTFPFDRSPPSFLIRYRHLGKPFILRQDFET